MFGGTRASFPSKTGFKLQHMIGQLSFSFEGYNFKETLQILISQKLTKVFVYEKYVPGRTFETSNYSQYVNIKYTVANAKVTCSK